MSAGSYNITIEQGATYSQVMTWRDSNNALVNLTGYTARMQIRTDYAATTSVLVLTTENGMITLGGALGTITLNVTDASTSAIPARNYVYDLELVSGGGLVTRLLQGVVAVSPEVTK